MKRWLAKISIACYLSALLAGVACHAMNFGLSFHPITYYFVWDMFCGWSAHEFGYHLIGEGESGAHYHLSPAPWNTFAPYGDLERGQYDTIGHAHAKIALNTLNHTDHEPITRMFLVEEMWPKKYNLPDHLWALRFDEPKDPHSYFWLKAIMSGDGTLLQNNFDLVSHLTQLAVADNPRLKADSLRGKPFITISESFRRIATTSSDGFHTGKDAAGGRMSGAGADVNFGTQTVYGADLHPSAN